MIHPTNQNLLLGVANALQETVLPELPRGTSARKQLQAALAILRRLATSLDKEASALAADNADMESALLKIDEMMPGIVPVSPLAYRNYALQQMLVDVQERLPALPPDDRSQVAALLTSLHKGLMDRAADLALPVKISKSDP
jgi:hypothetical protein